MKEIELQPVPVSANGFAEYGTLVEASDDGVPWGPNDAQLDLSQGRPRFYVMRLSARPLTFRTITRHMHVSQCLASADMKPWFIAVAAPLGKV